jgi:hypothetical protein
MLVSIFNNTPIATPNNEECAKVSPKYDILLQIIQQPKGAETNEIPNPASIVYIITENKC